MFAIYDQSGKISCIIDAEESTAALNVGHGQSMIEIQADEIHGPGVVYVDPVTQAVCRTSAPGPEYAFDWPTLQWVDPRDLDDLKAAAWARIKAARDAAEAAPLTVGAHVYDADPISVQRVMGAVQMAQLAVQAGQGADWLITWTLADNSPVQLSAAQMIDVGMSLATQISSAHARGRLLRAQIDAATDSAQLDLITWSS